MQLLSWLVGLAASVTLLGTASWAQPKSMPHLVSFAVTDCWGNPLNSATISVTSIESQATRERLDYPNEKALHLREGFYHVLAESQGFFPSSSVVRVSQGDFELRNCLTLAPVEGDTPPATKLDGSVAESVGQRAGSWARLVEIYSSTSISVPIDPQGHFSASLLQPGRYLLLILNAKRIIAQKEIDVRGQAVEVNIR